MLAGTMRIMYVARTYYAVYESGSISNMKNLPLIVDPVYKIERIRDNRRTSKT